MPGAPEDSARFELRRSRRPWGPAILLFLLALGMLLPAPELLPALAEDWPRLVMLLLGVLAAPLLVLGVGQKRPIEVIEVLPRVVRLPFGSTSVEIPLDEVEGVALEEGDRPGLFVATTRFVVFFPAQRFLTPDAARAAHDTLRARIGALPDGPRRVKAMDEVDFAAAPGPARRPWATQALLAVVGLGFLLAILSGDLSLERPLDVLRLGANARSLVSAGEWWRLPASVLLHVTPIHVALIAMSLLGLGVASERLLGGVGQLVVFLGSALAGALVSAAFPDEAPFTMGASGGVFGLLGALLYVYWRYRGRIVLRFQIPERTWFWMLAVNFLLPLLVPFVDGAMHLGGLVAGVLLAMLVTQDSENVPVERPSLSTGLAAVLLTLVFAGGVAMTARAHDDRAREKSLAVMRTMAGVERPDPDFLNRIAWGFAQDSRSSREELAAAERLAERAVDVIDRWDYRDTWATLAFRQGKIEQAVDLELEALADEASARKKEPRLPPQDAVIASQLARFLAHDLSNRGPIALRGPILPVRATTRDPSVVLTVRAPIEKPTVAWVLARDGDALVGLGRFPLAPTQEAPSEQIPRETIAWSRTATLSVALFTPGEADAKAWALDAQVLAYPGPIEAGR